MVYVFCVLMAHLCVAHSGMSDVDLKQRMLMYTLVHNNHDSDLSGRKYSEWTNATTMKPLYFSRATLNTK